GLANGSLLRGGVCSVGGHSRAWAPRPAARGGRAMGVAGQARLGPQARPLIERIAGSGAPPLHTLSPGEARRVYRESRAALAPAAPHVAEIRELSVSGSAPALRARLYRPRSGEESLPGVVYFHGGRLIYGDIGTPGAL